MDVTYPPLVHLSVEILHGTLYQPLCENNAEQDAMANLDDDIQLTEDEAQVTCPACLAAMGFESRFDEDTI